MDSTTGVCDPIDSRSNLARTRLRLWRRHWVWRVVWIALVIYLGLAIVLFAIQARLIFPGHEVQGQLDAIVQPPAGTTLVNLAATGGDRVVALFGPALTPDGRPDPHAASRPTILYFYGNGMCLNWALGEFDRFRRLGANVLIPDYVGYGMSSGQPSEAGCYATTDAAYAYLGTRRDVDRRTIVAAGWSLGGAVAIDLAARKPVAGLAVFCTFTSMTDMARRNYAFIPVSLFLRHRFESQAKIARVTCPILIGHGAADTLIPPVMARRLAAAAQAPVTRFSIEGANHNDFFTIGGPKIFKALGRFLDRLPNTTIPPARFIPGSGRHRARRRRPRHPQAQGSLELPAWYPLIIGRLDERGRLVLARQRFTALPAATAAPFVKSPQADQVVQAVLTGMDEAGLLNPNLSARFFWRISIPVL